MDAIIFNKVAADNKIIIDLPEILNGFMLEVQVKPLKRIEKVEEQNSLKGALSQYADIKKVEFESTAWIDFVEDKIDYRCKYYP